MRGTKLRGVDEMREWDLFLTLLAVGVGLCGLCWALITLFGDIARDRKDKADCEMWRQRRIKFREAAGMPPLNNDE